MTKKNNSFQIAKKGLVFAIAVTSLALASCESSTVEPKKPTTVLAMDPPLDTRPPRPPQ